MNPETAAASGADRVSCAQPPAGIERPPLESPTTEADNAAIGNGVHRLLYEAETDLTQAELAWRLRTVRRVLSREGAEQVAHFLVEFDPSFQRLEVHCVRVWRGGEAIEHGRREAIQVFRRETDIARSVLNGRMTASLVIPDLRVDDFVEIAITLYGTNPALGSKYSAWAGFDVFAPWSKTRYRLVRPARRAVLEKAFNQPPTSSATVRGETVESDWELSGLQRLDREDLAPFWAMESPSLQFSEYESWGEVAKLFAPYYVGELPSDLAGVVDAIALAQADPTSRAMEWLRFVQRELRYFGLALGEGGYVPRQPEEIWRARFGDCKDAALLYVLGARRLGLDVCPALISTTHGRLIDQFLPSATVFNHCIARLRINGRSYWLDPTLRPQGGGLDVVAQPFGGSALPIAEGVTALEPLGDPGVRHFLDLQETLNVGPKRDSIALYRRAVTVRFWAADELRGRFAVEGADPYAKDVLKELRTVWPGAEQTGEVAVDDDRAMNRIRVSTSYQIRDLWKAGDNNRLSFVIGDDVFARQLALLKRTSARRSAIYLGWPRTVTRRMTMTMPRKWPGQGWLKVQEGGGLRYETALAFDGRTMTYTKAFVADRPALAASDAESYHKVVAELLQNQLILSARQRFGRIRSVVSQRRTFALRIVFWLVVLLLWAAIQIASRGETLRPGAGPT